MVFKCAIPQLARSLARYYPAAGLFSVTCRSWVVLLLFLPLALQIVSLCDICFFFVYVQLSRMALSLRDPAAGLFSGEILSRS